MNGRKWGDKPMSEARPIGKYLPFSDWPENDKLSWLEAATEGDILDGRGPAAHWAHATRIINMHHYSRWLGQLLLRGKLDPDLLPQDRVTVENVRPYIQQLQSELAPRTVVSTLVGLKVMMKAMAPRDDWRWLADACNALNRTSRPVKDKISHMRPTGEIYATALAELQRLTETPLTRRVDRVAFRDTLMLALMAARPLRLKNFTHIRIGEHLVPEPIGWMLRIAGEDVKNGQHLEYDLPEDLISFLETYLDRVRPSFQNRHNCQALWLTFEGEPLQYHSLYCRIVLITKRLLGVTINPHLLRDCAATSLSNKSPTAALASAPLLGHRNFSTTERHYIRANQIEASRRINSLLSKIRSAQEQDAR